MKLFLTSSTITSNLVRPFEDLIDRDIQNLKCAFITDAMYAPEGVGKELADEYTIEDQELLIKDYNWQLTNIMLSEGIDYAWNNFDVLYVNGGITSHLIKVIRSTGFEPILKNLIEANIPYVGSSGGSMALSDNNDVASWYIGESDPGAMSISGLGYINFQIYPHFNKDQFNEIQPYLNPTLEYYFMEDSSAISINDSKMELCGKVYKLKDLQ